MAKEHISFDGQVFSTKKEMNNHETNFTRHRLITHYMDPTGTLKINRNTYLQSLVDQIRNLSDTKRNMVIEILDELAQKSHQKKYAVLRETLSTEFSKVIVLDKIKEKDFLTYLVSVNNANGVKSFVNILNTHLKRSVNWTYKLSPNDFYNSKY
jgi:hypothetical protein